MELDGRRSWRLWPRIINEPGKARVAKVQQDIRAIESALGLYKLDNFEYPTTAQGLEAMPSTHCVTNINRPDLNSLTRCVS